MKKFFLLCLTSAMVLCVQPSEACTGISLRSEDGSPVIARTIEWAGSDLNSRYVVVPRGYRQRSYTPSGQKDGMRFAAKYGYVGLAVERDEFVVDGMNEAGLAAGLFYFPQYGEYAPFDSTLVDESISDMQVVSWLLSRCASVDEAVSALQRVQIITTDPRGSTVHWRIADRTGKQVVVEVIAQQIRFYENTLGVLTNSPAFDWHLTNLNNFDIPVGIQFAEGETIPNIPSATQWTIATDLKGGRLYFRTMYNSRIRCLDLERIDFRKVNFRSAPLDNSRTEQIEMVW